MFPSGAGACPNGQNPRRFGSPVNGLRGAAVERSGDEREELDRVGEAGQRVEPDRT